MALIRGYDPFARPPMSESKLTQLWLEKGYAKLAPSERLKDDAVGITKVERGAGARARDNPTRGNAGHAQTRDPQRGGSRASEPTEPGRHVPAQGGAGHRKQAVTATEEELGGEGSRLGTSA